MLKRNINSIMQKEMLISNNVRSQLINSLLGNRYGIYQLVINLFFIDLVSIIIYFFQKK